MVPDQPRDVSSVSQCLYSDSHCSCAFLSRSLFGIKPHSASLSPEMKLTAFVPCGHFLLNEIPSDFSLRSGSD